MPFPFQSQAVPAREAPSELRPDHLPALDGVRGLAILLVMTTHFMLVYQGSIVDRLVGMVGRFGWSGVDLFFVLSGFLITGILLDNRDQPHYFRNFYARRTLRIFPLYYFVIFFATIVIPLLPFAWTYLFPIESWTKPLYWLYLSNFAIVFSGDDANDMLGLTWSLAIEEQFYLVWPILVLLLSRRGLMIACIGAVVVSIATRTAFVLAGADRLFAYVLTPSRMDGLAIGCIVALLIHGRYHRLRELLPKARWLAIGCGIVILALIGWHRTTGFRGGPGQAIGYTVIAVFYACVLMFALASTSGSLVYGFFTQGWLIVLGKFSYALYLFHMGIARLVRAYVYDLDDFHMLFGSRLPGQVIFYVICFSLSLLAAFLSWHLLEKHFLKLKVYFPSRKRLTTAAAWGGADVAVVPQAPGSARPQSA